jgi:hypothetical protein
MLTAETKHCPVPPRATERNSIQRPDDPRHRHTLGADILGVEFFKADREPHAQCRALAEHNPFQSSSLVK